MTYDEAVEALYQASIDEFVTVRKRLVAELKILGDKAGATKLAKRGRPTLSAWAVNQLWWNAREAFDQLFAASERIRHGELGAQTPHREALATLRGRAARLLTAAGHGANEGTLRRVATTLSALAASGSWSADAPGALAEDREAVGFDVALSLSKVPVRSTPTHPANPEAAQRALDKAETKRHDEAKRRAQELAQAEAKKAEEKAREARAAERSRLTANLATAQSELQRRHEAVTRLAAQLGIAEQHLAEAQDLVASLQHELEDRA